MSEAEEFEFRMRAEQEAGAVAVAEPPEPPSTLAVAGQSAVKGVASVADMYAGAPARAFNLASAGVGTVAGELGRPDIAAEMPIAGPAFTDPVRTAMQQPTLTVSGEEVLGPMIRPEREPETAAQRVLDRSIQTGVGLAVAPAKGLGELIKNMAVGALSGFTGGVTKEVTGSEMAALAVSVATPMGVKAFTGSAANQPTLKSPVRKETIHDAQKAGYVIPPSAVKPSFTTNKLESVAGKAAVRQEAAIRNQEVTNKLAARAIGLPEDTSLSMGALEGVRREAGKTYEKLNALKPGGELQGLNVKTISDRTPQPGPTTGLKVSEVRGPSVPTGLNVQEIRDEAGKLTGMRTGVTSRGTVGGPLESMKTSVTSRGQDVPGHLERMQVSVKETRGGNPMEELKQARADASVYYRHHNISGDPKSLYKANALSRKAELIEKKFEQIAEASGQSELIREFKGARTLIAKTYDIERALNLGDGNVSASIIGRILDSGRPLTGELKVIGKFAQAFPAITREGVTSAGVSGTDPGMSALLGLGGYAAIGEPSGAMAAGLPLVRGPARSALLSRSTLRIPGTTGYQGGLLAEQPVSLNQAALRGILAGREMAEGQ